jgi:hypothetical protein
VEAAMVGAFVEGTPNIAGQKVAIVAIMLYVRTTASSNSY